MLTVTNKDFLNFTNFVIHFNIEILYLPKNIDI